MIPKRKFYVVVHGTPEAVEFRYKSPCSSIFSSPHEAEICAEEHERDYEEECMVIEHEFTLDELEVLHQELDECYGCGWSDEIWANAED